MEVIFFFNPDNEFTILKCWVPPGNKRQGPPTLIERQPNLETETRNLEAERKNFPPKGRSLWWNFDDENWNFPPPGNSFSWNREDVKWKFPHQECSFSSNCGDGKRNFLPQGKYQIYAEEKWQTKLIIEKIGGRKSILGEVNIKEDEINIKS